MKLSEWRRKTHEEFQRVLDTVQLQLHVFIPESLDPTNHSF